MLFQRMTYFIISCLILTSCGYHIAGKTGKMPGDVTSISIPFFKNLTQKPDLETIITTSIIDEFAKSSIARVATDKGEAVLNGIITGYNLTPVSFTRNDVVSEYRVTINLEVRLIRSSDGKVLWEDKSISDYEDFKVTSSDVNATKMDEQAAVRKMAKDTARLIKERILEDF